MNEISSNDVRRLPRPQRGRAYYWSGVLPSGTVYMVNGSARFCGKGTRIMRWDGDFDPITTLPDGWEAVDLHPWSDGVDTRVIYGRAHCRRFDVDLFEVLDDND